MNITVKTRKKQRKHDQLTVVYILQADDFDDPFCGIRQESMAHINKLISILTLIILRHPGPYPTDQNDNRNANDYICKEQ